MAGALSTQSQRLLATLRKGKFNSKQLPTLQAAFSASYRGRSLDNGAVDQSTLQAVDIEFSTEQLRAFYRDELSSTVSLLRGDSSNKSNMFSNSDESFRNFENLGETVKLEPSNYKDELEEMETRIQAAEQEAPPSTSLYSPSLGIATIAEWQHLIVSAIGAKDGDSVFRIFDLAARSRIHLDDQLFTAAIQACVVKKNSGLARQIMDLAEHWNLDTPDMHTALITALVTESPKNAEQHLQALEKKGRPAEQAAYRTVMSAYFASNSRSEGWDLFAHMRMNAHSTPDIHTFDMVLRECASGMQPSAERAIDLFTELQELGHTPNAFTYYSLIKACMRTRRRGDRDYYGQGLEYLQQALRAGLAPNKKLMHAVLHGTKRTGDLARALWLFQRVLSNKEQIESDDETLAFLFETFASYQPPVKTGKTNSNSSNFEGAILDNTATGEEKAIQMDTDSHAAMLALPLSHRQALKQVKALFWSLLVGNNIDPAGIVPTPDNNMQTNDLRHIRITRRLLNSYFVAYGNLAPFAGSVQLLEQLFERCGLTPNPTTLLLIIERCEKKGAGQAGVSIAEEYFARWQNFTEKERTPMYTQRAWTSMIRNYAKNHDGDSAMALVRQFRELFPPKSAEGKQPAQIRPVSLSSDQYPETRNDPGACVLTFRDVASLHKEFADRENHKGIAELSRILNEYQPKAPRTWVFPRERRQAVKFGKASHFRGSNRRRNVK